MFIIVPIIIIFLLGSFLYINDTSIFTQIFIYLLMFATAFISIIIYKSIKKNLKQQEINNIQIEINEFLKNIQNSKDEQYIKLLENKIEILIREKKLKSN